MHETFFFYLYNFHFRYSNINFHEITVPPRWLLEPTDKAFAQGSNAKVECKADGFPKVSLIFSFIR